MRHTSNRFRPIRNLVIAVSYFINLIPNSENANVIRTDILTNGDKSPSDCCSQLGHIVTHTHTPITNNKYALIEILEELEWTDIRGLC